MNKKKVELIGTGFLVVILIFTLFANLSKLKPPKRRPKTLEAEKKKITDVSLPDYGALNKKFNAMSFDRDPFAKIQAALSEVKTAATFLKGIVWDEEAPSVIFGDEFLKIGQKVQDFKILEIKKIVRK